MDSASVPWDDSWFFIVGCQRSGTTLVRLVLECHSQVECRDETIAYGLISGRRRTRRARPLMGLKVPCLTEQFAAPRLFDVAWVPDVPNGYHGHRLIFLVRDVRDTAVSMLDLKVFGRSWFERSLRPTLQARIAREPDFASRHRETLAAIDQSPYPDLAAAGFYWRYKSEALYSYLAKGFPVLPIRYEDLVARPVIELLRICGFLRIGWESALLSHPEFTHRELDSQGRAMGGTEARRPIDTRSIGGWRDALTDSQCQELLAFAGPLQTQLYDAAP